MVICDLQLTLTVRPMPETLPNEHYWCQFGSDGRKTNVQKSGGSISCPFPGDFPAQASGMYKAEIPGLVKTCTHRLL